MDGIISSNALTVLHDYTNFLATTFESFLIDQHVSAITRKNYRSDLSNFLSWVIGIIRATYKNIPENLEKLLPLVTAEQIEEYRSELLSDNMPEATINRRLSSLRMLFRFAESQGWIVNNPAIQVKNLSLTDDGTKQENQNLLNAFKQSLIKEGVDKLKIKNYYSDVFHFLDWLACQPKTST